MKLSEILAKHRTSTGMERSASKESEYEKDKDALLKKLLEAYKLTSKMEGKSVSGRYMNETLMRMIEDFKKKGFQSWDSWSLK